MMATALVRTADNSVIEVFGGDVPLGYFFPNGVACATVGMGAPWTSEDGAYALLPALYDDAPANSRETGRSYAISNGVVQVTRTWEELPVPVPSSVTNAQARAVLMQLPSPVNTGLTLFDDIDAFCAAQGGIMRMAWDWVNEFTRDGAMVEQVLKSNFGMSDEQVDQLFIQAAAIRF